MTNLVERVFRGGAWVGAMRVLQKGVGFARKIILARLLFPDDFGLFGIALLLLEGFRVLTETGFKDALIHVREDVKEYIHTGYWIQVLQGLVTGLLVYIGAPLVAQFFSEPRVIPVVRVLAAARVIYGFRSIGVVMLRRELDFRTDSLYRLSGTLSYFVVTVILAIAWRDVWALVWGKVVSRSVMVVVSYYVHPFRPHFIFKRERAVGILRYGVWLLGSGIASYASLQADNIIAGKVVGTAALGVYQMAYVVSNLPTTEIAKQVGKVVQSGFAELQSDPERMDRMFQKVILTVFAVTLPLALGMALTAPTLIPVILGEKWSEIIPILPILAIGGLFRALGAVLGSLFKATGDTHLLFQMSWVRALVLGCGLAACVALSGGLKFIAYAFAASVTVKTTVAFFYAFKKYVSIYKVLERSKPTLISSSFMLSLLLLSFNFLVYGNIYVDIILLGSIGLVSYLTTHFFVEKKYNFRVMKYMIEKTRKMSNIV
jgi:O-antigen/teichoic acid export membrane protein